jgi:hypothetical protein
MTLVIVVPTFAQVPDGVSPGAVDRIAEIEGRCPTFIWGMSPNAIDFELVAYRLSEGVDRADLSAVDLSEADQVLYAKVPGSAPAWEPELAKCLTPGGNYVWFVRAVYREEEGEVVEASEWSYGRYFSISSMPSAGEVDEALRVLRRYAEQTADSEEIEPAPADTKRPAPSRRVAVPQQVPKSVTSAKTAIKGTVSETTGETYGVVGISNSPSGAGMAAGNTGGGADLVLDGLEDGDLDTVFTQAGIDRTSSEEEWFSLINSGAGVLSLSVEGQIVADGSGLTAVDADTLDGADGSDFATDVEAAGLVTVHAASADHDSRYFTETELGTSGSSAVHWGNLTTVPSGLDDGDDDTTYTFGDGLVVVDGVVRMDPTYLLTRISTIDSGGFVGRYASIAIGADGLGLISYFDDTNDDLKVAHCDDTACTGATTATLDSGSSTGLFTSIALGADGLGLISYYDLTNQDLKVAHCADAACTSATTATLDSTDDVGGGSSIVIGADGLGLISYLDETNDDLKVAHCNDTACTSATTTAVDSTGNVGRHASMALGADGLGLISYRDEIGDLKVAHCADTACTSATITTLDSVGDVGSYTSIAIGADGLGLISYHDQTNGDLKVAQCNDTFCTSATSTILDSAGDLGETTSIAIGTDGLGLISYWDVSNLDLKVAHLGIGVP